MSVGIYSAICRRAFCAWVPRGMLALICCIGIAGAQVKLPEVLVRAAKPKPKPATAARVRAAPAPATRATPAERLATQTAALNQGLNTIYPTTGTAPTTISHNAIEALPQGANATVEKIVLRFPGVTQDSAASGSFHVRNEHANVHTRINGIMLPDGVSGFGTFLDTALIGNISLITGALPPQFGLRTSGVLDIWTRSDAFNNTGNVGIYGGSRGMFTPSIEYGGTIGQTQYFITGRFFESNIGLENPTANWNAIHNDHTTQERGFGYVSTLLDPYTRVTFLAGASYARFQIPNTPGLTPNFTAFGVSTFNSALLNENQLEQNYYGVAALQRSINGADVQLSYFTRYSSVHFTPDPIGDLVFNGVIDNPNVARMAPYYIMMRLAGDPRAEFFIMLPMVPSQRENMIAWLAARCDPPDYGKLIVYEFPKDNCVRKFRPVAGTQAGDRGLRRPCGDGGDPSCRSGRAVQGIRPGCATAGTRRSLVLGSHGPASP